MHVFSNAQSHVCSCSAVLTIKIVPLMHQTRSSGVGGQCAVDSSGCENNVFHVIILLGRWAVQ